MLGGLGGLVGRRIWGSGKGDAGDILTPQEKTLMLAGAAPAAASLLGVMADPVTSSSGLPAALGGSLGGALTGGLAGLGLAQI